MSQGRRSANLPRNWNRIRAAILKRDGFRCTWFTDGVRCSARATDVDHIVPAHRGGGDDPDNLRSLCKWHHDRKTGREAHAARVKVESRNRPAESHPGFIN